MAALGMAERTGADIAADRRWKLPVVFGCALPASVSASRSDDGAGAEAGVATLPGHLPSATSRAFISSNRAISATRSARRRSSSAVRSAVVKRLGAAICDGISRQRRNRSRC